MLFIRSFKIIILIFIITVRLSLAQVNSLMKIDVKETQGLDRELEYVEFLCQLEEEVLENSEVSSSACEITANQEVDCQVIVERKDNINNKVLARIIFPVAVKAYEEKQYLIKTKIEKDFSDRDIILTGQSTELVIENKYFLADLRKNDSIEGHSYMSGQIRELQIKMGFDQRITNAEDRLHWAPNFKRPELEYYTTIAHWQKPKINEIVKGQYQITTLREDLAPSHPEILLTARYRFYANLPYFRFYSRMEMKNNVWLELLRNDEMAMDSMFTHMAFQRPNGEIVDVEFSERHDILNSKPIENNSPWLCFYNLEKGFAFGSIRINYDNTNNSGGTSPTYEAHTQIGEWLKGVKYWNRRLIHDHLTFVPEGSCYTEDNAYLVFKINEEDKLKDIRYWSERIRSPLQISIEYLN